MDMGINMNYNGIDLTKTSAYDYELPKELIAQDPAEPRDSSRLLVVKKDSFDLEHMTFRDITGYLKKGDLLVLNDTRVLPARVTGIKKNREVRAEIFFLRPAADNTSNWTALVRPGRKLPEGTVVTVGNGVDITVGKRVEDGLRYIEFPQGADPFAVIHEFGETPLPHYITNTHADPERYQTVYSKADKENSVAAPTAGLHFTDRLLEELKMRGVDQAFITLQVGLGTFRPVKTDIIAEHIMHNEFCEVPAITAEKIKKTRESGGRVIAVGTTVVRTLESFARHYDGEVRAGTLDTRLFITPGFDFRVINGLITNFHLPKSTLLMLVSAFGGYDVMMNAYKEAVEKRYRFFSFGDAMFIA